MLKPITECSREERLERALLAIECFAMHHDEDSEWGKVYMIAHSAVGRCGNPHTDWLPLIEECEKAGVEHKFYDAEKILTRHHHATVAKKPHEEEKEALPQTVSQD